MRKLSSPVERQFGHELAMMVLRWRREHPEKHWYYHGPADFTRRAGQRYQVAHALPGFPNLCFNNAMGYVLNEPTLRYVEGFAMMPISNARFNVAGPEVVHHAWVQDTEFDRAYEVTWPMPGRFYMGTEFDVLRADDATWNGDGAVIEDGNRGHPLFRQKWTGEFDWSTFELDTDTARRLCATGFTIATLVRQHGYQLGSSGIKTPAD